MYCHGFGDFFLITFNASSKPYRVLIDCGLLTGDPAPLRQALNELIDETKGELDVVVQTHEHKDHVSGFNLKGPDGVRIWNGIRVKQVWQAWTEDPTHKLARTLKIKQAQKKDALDLALREYKNSIDSDKHKDLVARLYRGPDYLAAERRFARALGQVLDFNNTTDDLSRQDHVAAVFGYKKSPRLTVSNAMQYFAERCKDEDIVMKYLRPGTVLEEKDTELPGVRFYVLGPPENEASLRMMDDPTHKEMYLDNRGFSDNFYLAILDNLAVDERVSGDLGREERVTRNIPFAEEYVFVGGYVNKSTDEDLRRESSSEEPSGSNGIEWNVVKSYQSEENAWRAIELDWLHNTGVLALHLDSYTNNTSLALAIEIPTPEGDKVLLFPGDAQIGNWITWTEKDRDGNAKLTWTAVNKSSDRRVEGEDILQKTAFYKVGHHASHNATARKHGLELMSDDLIAMIPVDEEVASNQGKRGWIMPAPGLLARLIEKTRGRIIRSDTGVILESGLCKIPVGARPTKAQKEDFLNRVVPSSSTYIDKQGNQRHLYYEYKISI